MNHLVYPTEQSTTVNGLTVTWPDVNTLSDGEKKIVSLIYTYWLKESLVLTEKSYGLRFDEPDTVINYMNLRFENITIDAGAYID